MWIFESNGSCSIVQCSCSTSIFNFFYICSGQFMFYICFCIFAFVVLTCWHLFFTSAINMLCLVQIIRVLVTIEFSSVRTFRLYNQQNKCAICRWVGSTPLKTSLGHSSCKLKCVIKSYLQAISDSIKMDLGHEFACWFSKFRSIL